MVQNDAGQRKTVEDGSESTGRQPTVGRRSLLRTAAAAGAAYGSVGLTAAAPPKGKGSRGFPPNGTTTFGEEIDLGNGNVRTFTTETPSGQPKHHGVEFERAALEGLPDATELENGANDEFTDKYGNKGNALVIHRKWSLEFFVEFPDAANTPFTFLGLNWNPKGHPGGAGAWTAPHFDIHFHMLDQAEVDAIEGPALPPYDDVVERNEAGLPTRIESELDPEQLPEGYVRSPPQAAGERYITDMGEHLAPKDAPELPANPEAFGNTLIQGIVGRGPEKMDPELAFVEPMITTAFLDAVEGTEVYDVPQPAVYPHELQHPTAYGVRDVPSRDAICVTLQDFTQV